MSDGHRTELPTILTVLRGASGYLTAGIACTLAGYSLGNGKGLPVGDDLVQLAIFWILLAAGLTNHAALYEQRGVKRRHVPSLQALARHVPVVLILMAVSNGILHWDYRDGHKDYARTWFIPLLIAFIPLGAIAIHRTVRWRDAKLFTFPFRSYFPALATCLPAFILGYYLQSGQSLLAVSAVLILILWLASVYFSLRVTFAVQALMLLIAIVFVFLQSGPILVSIFGVFLTLAMGVSEAWRFTTRVWARVEYRPSGRYTTEEQHLFLAGTNIATALFLPLFLTTSLHPQTEPSYLLFVILALVVGYLLWFNYSTSWSYKIWTAVSFLFGISLPWILAIGAQTRGQVTQPSPLQLESLGPLFTLLGSVSTVGFGAASLTYIKMYIEKQSFGAHFVHSTNAIELTAVVSVLLAYIGYFTAFGLRTMNNPSLQSNRLNWLILIYVSLSAMTFSFVWVTRKIAKFKDAAQARESIDGR